MLKGADLKEVLSQAQAAEKVYQLKKTAEETNEGFFDQKLLKVKREKKNKSDSYKKSDSADKYEKEEEVEKNLLEEKEVKNQENRKRIDVRA